MVSIVNQQNPPNQQTQHKQSKQSSKKSSGETTLSRVQDVPGYKELEEVKKSLVQSKSLEVIGDILDVQTTKVVLSTKREYFDDGDPSVMVDGEFYVIGKVVRVVDSNSGQSINLLRKTAFVGLNTAEIFEGIGDEAISKSEGKLNLPALATEIYGPAIQMIPIAIFV